MTKPTNTTSKTPAKKAATAALKVKKAKVPVVSPSDDAPAPDAGKDEAIDAGDADVTVPAEGDIDALAGSTEAQVATIKLDAVDTPAPSIATSGHHGTVVGGVTEPDLGGSLDSQAVTFTRSDGKTLTMDKVHSSSSERDAAFAAFEAELVDA